MEVHTATFAGVGCGRWAGNGAGSVVTEFAFFTDGATLSTVSTSGLEIGAGAIAEALAC